MSKKKTKGIKWEKMIHSNIKSYNPKRAIKDIDNNNKHKPKGER